MKIARLILAVLFFAMLAVFSANVYAEEAETGEAETGDMWEMGIDDLLDMEVTTASKTKRRVSEAPAIVSVITQQEIEDMGARSMEDILRTVVSLDPIMNYYNDTQISIRGISSGRGRNNKIKIMMDGHSLGTFMTGDPFKYMSSVPVENIARIEIIRGPGSALYGANAFVGVINIITKDGEAPSKVSFRGGSFDTYKPTLELAHKSDDDDLKVYLYGDYFTTDGPELDVNQDFAQTTFGPTGTAVPGKTNEELENYDIQFKSDFKGLYLNAFYRETIEQPTPIGLLDALTDENENDDSYYFVEGGYETSLGEDEGSLLIKAYYDLFTHESLYEFFPEETGQLLGPSVGTPYPATEGLESGPNNESSIIGTELTVAYDVIEELELVVGGLYEDQEVSEIKHISNHNNTGAPFTYNGVLYTPYQYLGGLVDISSAANWAKEGDRQVTAAYAQGILDLASLLDLEDISSFAITAGVRYDDYDDVGDTTNPRAGLVFGPTEELYFKLLYGTAFRAPSFTELYTTNNPAVNGSPNIDPEELETIEAQVGYDFTEKVRSNVTLFTTEIKDVVTSVTGPTGAAVYGNYGKLESTGVEGELKYHYEQNTYGFVNATYQEVYDTTNETITSDGGQVHTKHDFNPGGIPRVLANLGITYELAEDMLGNVTVNYIGERKRSQDVSWVGENLVRSDQRDSIDAQTLVSAALTFKDIVDGLDIQVSGFNLFDEYHTDPDSTGRLVDDYKRARRTLYGKIAYRF